jgi:hypothetical protein
MSAADHKPPPTPVSTCTFPRDVDFIEREVMSDVMRRCHPGVRLALTGIGGVGYVTSFQYAPKRSIDANYV